MLTFVGLWQERDEARDQVVASESAHAACKKELDTATAQLEDCRTVLERAETDLSRCKEELVHSQQDTEEQFQAKLGLQRTLGDLREALQNSELNVT